LFSATSGYLDDIPTNKIAKYEKDLFLYLDSRASDVLEMLRKKKELTEEVTTKLDAAIKDFTTQFKAGIAGK